MMTDNIGGDLGNLEPDRHVGHWWPEVKHGDLHVVKGTREENLCDFCIADESNSQRSQELPEKFCSGFCGFSINANQGVTSRIR